MIISSCLLIFAMFPIVPFAQDSSTNEASGTYESKDEVIYGKLDPNGRVNNMYVVNAFNLKKPGAIIDYGKYNAVRNLTDLSKIEQTGKEEVRFQAEDDFYYQGELDNQPLPWDISITYMIDGEEIEPDQLAGKSGALEIHIETSKNKDVDPVFFNYYMLQISLVLDPVIFTDIQAPEGTEANEGTNKMMNFTVMPEQEEVFILSAHVTDLELEPIDISAVPANIGFDNPDTDELAEEMQELADAIKDINAGVGKLENGISEVGGGAHSLRDGSSEFQSGMNDVNNSSGKLISGSEEILASLQEFSGAMEDTSDVPDLDELEGLPDDLRQIATGISEFNETLDALDEAIQDIPDAPISDEEIQSVYDALEESDAGETVEKVVEELEATYQAAQAVRKISEHIPNDLFEVNEQMAVSLENVADGLENAMNDVTLLDDLATLQSGLTTMASEYETFHDGLVTYTTGVDTLTASYGELHAGTKELAGGMDELENGAQKLREGTNELQKETKNLPDEFQSEIDAFMDEFDFSDFEATSFVSSENKNVNIVQFVLQTESIEIEEEETEPEEKEEEKNLWDRFLDLFR